MGEKVKLVGGRYRTLRTPEKHRGIGWEPETIRTSMSENGLATQDKLLGGRLTKVYQSIFTSARDITEQSSPDASAGAHSIKDSRQLEKDCSSQVNQVDVSGTGPGEEEQGGCVLLEGSESGFQFASRSQKPSTASSGADDAGDKTLPACLWQQHQLYQPWQTDYMSNFSRRFSGEIGANNTKLISPEQDHYKEHGLMSKQSLFEDSSAQPSGSQLEVDKILKPGEEHEAGKNVADEKELHHHVPVNEPVGLPHPTFFSKYYEAPIDYRNGNLQLLNRHN